MTYNDDMIKRKGEKMMKKVMKFFTVLLVIGVGLVTWNVISNQFIHTAYSQLDETDQQMLQQLSVIYSSFENSSDELWDENYRFDQEPLILARVDKTLSWGWDYGYAFNVDGVESMMNVKEIEVPEELNLPKVYRVGKASLHTPMIWFKANFGLINVSDEDVYYFKYHPDMIRNAATERGLSNFMIHEGFHYYKQTDWIYDREEHISNYPYVKDNLALIGIEYKLLDEALAAENPEDISEILKKWTIVRSERYATWPQLIGETKVEAMEGSAVYLEDRYNRLVFDEKAEQSTNSEVVTFEQIFDMMADGQLRASILERKIFYETGSILEYLMDEMGLEWKSKMEDSAEKRGMTQYEILKETFSVEQGEDFDAQLETIKVEYGYEDALKSSEQILENMSGSEI